MAAGYTQVKGLAYFTPRYALDDDGPNIDHRRSRIIAYVDLPIETRLPDAD
jgi:hypothetical protein